MVLEENIWCVHSVHFIFLCLICPRFSDEAYFFSSRLIFVIFDVKYFCIEAKIEIKFVSPPPAWSEKSPVQFFFSTLFKEKCFFDDFQGEITLFLFLESEKKFSYLPGLFWKSESGRGSKFFLFVARFKKI